VETREQTRSGDHGVGLTAVFGDVGVNEVHYVRTDGSAHDIRNGKSYVTGESVAISPSREWTVTRGRAAAAIV
jgi:hypothetical protein